MWRSTSSQVLITVTPSSCCGARAGVGIAASPMKHEACRHEKSCQGADEPKGVDATGAENEEEGYEWPRSNFRL